MCPRTEVRGAIPVTQPVVSAICRMLRSRATSLCRPTIIGVSVPD